MSCGVDRMQLTLCGRAFSQSTTGGDDVLHNTNHARTGEGEDSLVQTRKESKGIIGDNLPTNSLPSKFETPFVRQ